MSAEHLQAVTITFADGMELVVPDSIENITPYVLLEQGDWFEIEATFVRELLQPGMQVLDIGANFGVYTIPMAERVGEQGEVWAFEPCRNTFDHLMQSVKLNELNNTTLIRSGLGEKQAIVRLATGADAELNAITSDNTARGEMIDLTTLDTCLTELELQSIDFIKLDAEGYESKVLEGGQKLLRQFEPLVMFELRHNETVNLGLVEDFEQLGMQPYALIPGVRTLVPFDPAQVLDPFRLNLFACPDAWVSRLQQRDLLATEEDLHDAKTVDASFGAQSLNNIAAALDLPQIEVQKASLSDGCKHATAMRQCLAVEAGHGSSAERVATLRQITGSLAPLLEDGEDVAGLSLLARSARLLGEQNQCVQATVTALEILANRTVRPELMLPSLSHYDAVPVGENFHAWVVSHFLECFELSRAFSSFWLHESSVQNLRILKNMGYASEGMSGRLALIEQRLGVSDVNPAADVSTHTVNEPAGDPMQAPASALI